jgi:hypothetical protein
MFVAFMPLHILLSDEVLPYFVLRVEVYRCLNLNLNQRNLNLHKRESKVNPTLPDPTRDNGIRFKPAWVKGFALSQLNPANLDSLANLTRLTRPDSG